MREESFGKDFEMKWSDVPGWFDFQDLYQDMVRSAKPGSHFVEVGAWMGRSTIYLATLIRDSGKPIVLDAVDTWEGSPEREHREAIAKLEAAGTTLYDTFLSNVRQCQVLDIVNPVRMPSVLAARTYPDRGLDFVFIDGEHTYEAVCEDIRAWLPKVKKGGILAGHDYPHPPVKKATQDVLGVGVAKTSKRSWIYRVVQ